MDRIHDMIIIGAGPGGCTAAIYASRMGLQVLMLERATPGGQMTYTGEVENYPGLGEGISGIELAERFHRDALRFGAEFRLCSVLALNPEGELWRVVTDEGDLLCRTVVISTGADPKSLGLPSERELVGRGVHYCAHCDGRFYRGRTVAVVGGGNTALSDAIHLSSLASKVYLIHRRNKLRADKWLVNALAGKENVEVIYNNRPIAIEGGKGVTGLRLASTDGDERVINCDGIFIAIGRSPATKFLEGRVELVDGYVKAGDDTSTSAPGVFAVGDVRTKELRQIITAAADGAVAAEMAARYLAEKYNPEM